MPVRFVGPFFVDELLQQKRAAFGDQLRAAKLKHAVVIVLAERDSCRCHWRCEAQNFACGSYRIGFAGADRGCRTQGERGAKAEMSPQRRVQCSVLRSHSSMTAAI